MTTKISKWVIPFLALTSLLNFSEYLKYPCMLSSNNDHFSPIIDHKGPTWDAAVDSAAAVDASDVVPDSAADDPPAEVQGPRFLYIYLKPAGVALKQLY